MEEDLLLLDQRRHRWIGVARLQFDGDWHFGHIRHFGFKARFSCQQHALLIVEDVEITLCRDQVASDSAAAPSSPRSNPPASDMLCRMLKPGRYSYSPGFWMSPTM